MSDGIQGRHEVGGPQQTPEPPKEPKGVKKLFTDISTRLGGWVRQIGNSRFFSTYKVLPLSEEQADKLEQKKTRNFFQKFFGLGKASSNSSVQQAEEAPPSFQDLSITEKRKAVGNLHNRLEESRRSNQDVQNFALEDSKVEIDDIFDDAELKKFISDQFVIDRKDFEDVLAGLAIIGKQYDQTLPKEETTKPNDGFEEISLD